MNHLTKHIEALMQEYDCIIIPQFGGFVTQIKEASVSNPDGLLMPPVRTIGFNDKLHGNDGLLVQSYVDAYQVDSSAAKKMLQEDILHMREVLLHEGSYDLGSLGSLNQDEDGEIIFIPGNGGWSSPDFYGLDALDFPMLPADALPASEEMAVASSEAAVEKESDQHITFRIERKMLHTVMTVAAAILLFFLVSTPVNNHNWQKNQAVLGRDILTSALSFLPKMEQKSVPVVSAVPAEAVTDSVAADSVCAVPELEHEFAVVIASAIPTSNAEDYVAHLQNRGFQEASVLKHGTMNRVVFRGYASEEEARNQMRELHADAEFRGAWVYQIK